VSRESLLMGSATCKDRAIVRYATGYILIPAFAFNTVCGVLPRLGRGFGPPATDKLPDWKRIVTGDFKIRSLQVKLHYVTSNSIGRSVTARGMASMCSLVLASAEISRSDTYL